MSMIQVQNTELCHVLSNPSDDTTDKQSEPVHTKQRNKIEEETPLVYRWNVDNIQLKPKEIILGSFAAVDAVLNGVLDVALDIVLDVVDDVLEVVLDALAVTLDGLVLGTVAEKLDGVDTVVDILLARSVGLLDLLVDEPVKPAVQWQSVKDITLSEFLVLVLQS